jgi:hypothetical protein
VEDTDQPGWRLSVRDGQTVVADIHAESLQSAMSQAVGAMRMHLQDPFITQESLVWLRV